MSPSARPFPADLRLLTALRAFAAMLVVLYHLAARSNVASVLHTTLIDRGQLGVDIFFVLSGFILAHVYLARVQAKRFAFAEFLSARIARLYPMHLAMLAAAAAVGWLAMRHGQPLAVYGPPMGLDPATGGGLAGHLAANLALVQAWGALKGYYFNDVSWSISAEAAAYILFPVIAAAALAFGNKSWLRLIAALMVYGACESVARAFLGTGLDELTWHFGVLRILPEFALGVAFYKLGMAKPLPAAVLRWLTPTAIAAVLLLMSIGTPVVILPPLFGAVILLLAASEREGLAPPSWLLRPLVYLGEISYSTYMLHLLLGTAYLNVAARVFHIDPQALPSWQIAGAVLVVLLASSASYHLIEQPGRRLLRAAMPPAALSRRVMMAGR
jgi:peptidoglycan/LPS O-acetylase OafA/YrhL